MKILDLLEQTDYECIKGSMDTEVTAVVYDSRKDAEG